MHISVRNRTFFIFHSRRSIVSRPKKLGLLILIEEITLLQHVPPARRLYLLFLACYSRGRCISQLAGSSVAVHQLGYIIGPQTLGMELFGLSGISVLFVQLQDLLMFQVIR